MKKDLFEQEMILLFRDHLSRYPDMQAQDSVKFAFQGMLGVGHLLGDRAAVTDYIIREMNGLTPDPEEPLYEALSPAWCRLNLRRAMADDFPPSVIAGLMLASPAGPDYTRQDVRDFCRKLAGMEIAGLGNVAECDLPEDENFLPSHSDIYREKYLPAYRVISAEWLPVLDAVRAVVRKKANTERVLITLDGPCASGKTTLAGHLAHVFESAVVHTDDYVIPHAQKTAERLAVPGGNCDVERLAGEVVQPWKQGLPVHYRRYDCRGDRLLPPAELPPGSILILEGSYCNLPGIRKYADIRLFLDAAWETRYARLLQRESAASLEQFEKRWIPLENAYFSAFGLPDDDCIVIRAAT